eukprot:TRINITY_DN15575_c0_g1_i2.p1 TRINITY_DN15575_c0_g1~~TRINITY_DN15575_c0_g1_i2.p1  ORF type:complete len:799 (+),score=301.99 TRINITY_DN15575_c0_g1_i2:92-2398(+)
MTLAVGWAMYLPDVTELHRITLANKAMVARLEELNENIPLDARVSEGSEEGVETWVFLIFMLFMALWTVRFLLREYKLLCRTRSKIVAATEQEEFLSHEVEEMQRYDAEVTARRRLVKNFIFYRLDYWFSASSYSKPLALLFLTLVLIINGGGLYYTVKTDTLGSAMWKAWAFIADSGAHADETDTAARVVGLFLTIGGMLVFALVIGLISDAISDEFDSLKRGKARVIETDHTLILGWTDKTLPLIREIANANESLVKEGKTCVIVVLAECDKEVMEQETRNSNINLRGSMVVFRKGNPCVLHDLQHVSAKTARSVIVLSPVGLSADEADAKSLRVVLCLVGLGYKQGHVTVEIADVDNRELVHIIGGSLVETVVAHDFIGRLIIQSSRQKGLAPILERILGFEGCEFYMEEWPELVGKAFSEVLFSFDDAIPIGIKMEDSDSKPGSTILNPDDDFKIEAGMQIIVLSEDDDTYSASSKMLCEYPPPKAKRCTPVRTPLRQEKVLFVGWRRDLADMLRELDEVVAPGSTLTLFNSVPLAERDIKLEANGRTAHKFLNNLKLVHAAGNPVVRRELERLPVEEYDSIFILADEDFESDMETADGRSLTSLLLIHDIRNHRLEKSQAKWVPSPSSSSSKKRRKPPTFAVVSEVLDPRTRSLISLAKVSDYVMSNEMVSAALAMVAECRDVNAILKELLSSDGNEIYVRGIEEYTQPGKDMSFWEMMSTVRTHNSILLGYRTGDEPVLNPVDKHTVRKWNKGDKLVVLSED